MPTYAYACTECGHNFEAVQSFSDDALTVCPECEGRLRKVFSTVGVVFKGSGFYRNDSRADAGKVGAGKSNGDSAATKTADSTGAGGANGADKSSSADKKSGRDSGSKAAPTGSSAPSGSSSGSGSAA